MGKRTTSISKQHLIDAPLPQHASSYTVIPHEFVINKAMEELTSKGFQIKEELYRCNQGAQIAQGTYFLNYGSDPEMGMMFAWSNSYDKSMRFKCAIGGYVHVSMNRIISGDIGSWGRKHTGSADVETESTIKSQVDNADLYYTQLVHDKNQMQDIIVNMSKKCEILGRLFVEHGILNVEQISEVKREIVKPSFNYQGDKDSLWAFYNHITHALKSSHPKEWMDHQRMVHWFITNEFNIENSIVGIIPSTTVKEDEKKPGHQITLEEGIQTAEREVADGNL